jgi:hypothetical protein
VQICSWRKRHGSAIRARHRSPRSPPCVVETNEPKCSSAVCRLPPSGIEAVCADHDFQEDGRALKILPCGHTLCENCAKVNNTCRNGCENSLVKDAIPLVGMLFHVADSDMKHRLEKRPKPDPRATVLLHYRRVQKDDETEEEYNRYLEKVEDLILRYSEDEPKVLPPALRQLKIGWKFAPRRHLTKVVESRGAHVHHRQSRR